MVGYTDSTTVYQVYLPHMGAVKMARDCVFAESDIIFPTDGIVNDPGPACAVCALKHDYISGNDLLLCDCPGCPACAMTPWRPQR